MWALIIASSVCGLLFGRYFKMYALIPAALVIAGIAYFLASKQGMTIGVLSLVLATVAMQLCVTSFRSRLLCLWITSSLPKRPPKNFSSRTENGSRQQAASVGGSFNSSSPVSSHSSAAHHALMLAQAGQDGLSHGSGGPLCGSPPSDHRDHLIRA